MELDWNSMLTIAIGEARSGLAEGGLPIGAAMFNSQGHLLSSGHNRRVQQGDPPCTRRPTLFAAPAGYALW